MDEPLRTLVYKNLFAPDMDWDRLAWKPFRAGVRIHRLYGNSESGPSAAFLRYDPGAGIPRHRHTGYEHIIIFSEAQSDERGVNDVGSLVINPPGSSHTVRNEQGGVVLVIWEKPVVFEEADPGEPVGGAKRPKT